MDEAQEILLNSLVNSGISLPAQVLSIKDLNQDALVSICAQSLGLIDTSLSFPRSLPDSMAERIKICSEISVAVKSLGYRRDLSFHQFLYPSEEDSYKLIRFLVERLSETSEGGNVANKEIKARFKEDQHESSLKDGEEKVDVSVENMESQATMALIKDLKLEKEAQESLDTITEYVLNRSFEACSILEHNDEPGIIDVAYSGLIGSTKNEMRISKDVKQVVEESSKPRKDACEKQENAAGRNENHVKELQKLCSLQQRSCKLRSDIADLRSQEKILTKEVTNKTSESQHSELEHEVLNEAIAIFEDQHGVAFHVEELNKRVAAERQKLVKLESQWASDEKSLAEKKGRLENSLYAQNPDMMEKLQKMKEIELETEAFRTEIRKREEEHSKLSVELENQPKVASRKSYIERITEITKNSRKQDVDIERILKETRELQIESNSMQDRLHRTYAVVDEALVRDAKKDPVRRQAHMLLSSIHESFEQISQKILATDRIRREISEQEAKLATMSSRSLNIDKLRADLESIKKENELLEQHLQ